MELGHSFITQVSRDDEAGTHSLSSGDKANVKPRPPGLLEQFLCCFRQTSSHPSQTRSTQTAPCSPVPTIIPSSDPDSIKVPENHLLQPMRVQDKHKKCVVIDLDETLVHSSFAPVHNADFVIPVEIDGTIHQVYVLKRPYVDEFLQKMGDLFECVLFTASLGKYADPVTDLLDKWGVFRFRLFRESCVFHKGSYVKDLSRLGRDLNKTVILDNSPASYMFHPQNAVPIVSWFDDPSDRELLELMPFFENLARIDDVCTFLSNANLPNGCITFAVSNIEEDVDNVSSAAVPSVTSPLMSSNPVTAVAQVS